LLTIREVAHLLGVSLPTLRRWDAKGKFRARRHPINGYRMYSRREVLRLRDEIVRAAE
jgi:excisionase family DNA binding protein